MEAIGGRDRKHPSPRIDLQAQLPHSRNAKNSYMTAQRRLPPLNALRAFETVARNGSVTRAARELSVTQGAVSRHVRALEEWLNAKLVERTQHGIRLTAQGATYFRALRGALDQIDHATRQLQQSPDENLLRLKLPPTFAIRWLVPRLAAFHALHPAIDVQITTSHERADFDREDIDACIHSEADMPSGPGFRRLVGEVLLPVCSPRLIERGPPLKAPADLAHHVLLCSLNRPDDWPAWLEAAGVSHIDGNSGLKFENAALAYQAAIDELGVTIAQRALVEDDLRTGRLVAPIPFTLRRPGGYYLAYPPYRPRSVRVAAFEDWVVNEARDAA
jgi:LysR family transcriptional regulator, glycine cleavage system transcriptional activator